MKPTASQRNTDLSTYLKNHENPFSNGTVHVSAHCGNPRASTPIMKSTLFTLSCPHGIEEYLPVFFVGLNTFEQKEIRYLAVDRDFIRQSGYGLPDNMPNQLKRSVKALKVLRVLYEVQHIEEYLDSFSWVDRARAPVLAISKEAYYLTDLPTKTLSDSFGVRESEVADAQERAVLQCAAWVVNQKRILIYWPRTVGELESQIFRSYSGIKEDALVNADEYDEMIIVRSAERSDFLSPKDLYQGDSWTLSNVG